MAPPQFHVVRELFKIATLQMRIELHHALQAAQDVHIGLKAALDCLGEGARLLLETHVRHRSRRILLMAPQREAAQQSQNGNDQARHPEPKREAQRGRLGHQGIR
ncbi:hypothetical protein [Diaphorobacter caeni]|uniref:hypothetical protein n=1 Tax=Diaphorobacter caeni TaxID=2784387 RepID=UPI002B2764EC|nr:hypothetical protein [Diaphorobacter caeni]